MTQESEKLDNPKRLDSSCETEDELRENSRSDSEPESLAIEEEFDEEEFFDAEEDDEFGYRTHPSRNRIGIFCFNCNRREGQFLYRQNRWYYSFLIGMTFGLIKIIGPFQCQCCGARRFMCSDWISLRYLLKLHRDRKISRSKKGKFNQM